MILDHIQKLTVECSNVNGINPSSLNPLIKIFREKLEAIRLQDEYKDLRGRIVDLDEFRFEQPTPNLVMLYWDICKWVITNLASERIHGQARQRAAKMLTSVEICEDGTTLKITNVDHR